MPMHTYYETLKNEIRKKGSCFCLGLDINVELLPPGFSKSPEGIRQFCREIIDISNRKVAAYKFNFAFFEYFGSEGYAVLEECVEYASGKALLIADAKRGDIGNTARFYAHSIFGNLPFDACTVNPYMGEDAILPFLEYSDKGVYILCLTSNPSAGQVQHVGGEEPVYRRIITLAGKLGNRQCGLVVGATKGELLKKIALQNPQIPFLIPGIGAQGGDAGIVSNLCKEAPVHLVNISRGALYPGEGAFPENVIAAVERYSRLFKTKESDEKG